MRSKAFEFSKKLFEAGVFAPAVVIHRGGRQSAAAGHCSATHKRDQLLRAADILAEVLSLWESFRANCTGSPCTAHAPMGYWAICRVPNWLGDGRGKYDATL